MDDINTRKKLTFRKDIYCYIFTNAQFQNISFARYLNNLLYDLSSEFIETYHDVNLAKENKDYVPKSLPDTTRKKEIRLSYDVFNKVSFESAKRNQTFSQYINLAVSAAMNYDEKQQENNDKIIVKNNKLNDDVIVNDVDLTADSILANIDAKNVLSLDIKNSYLVNKSKPMVDLIACGYNLTELKIVDLISCRINPQDPTKDTIMFSKSDLERALGVKQIVRQRIDKYFSHFMQPIDLGSGEDGFFQVNLFSAAKTENIDNKKSWFAVISCTRQAGLFYDLKKFDKFTIGDVLGLTSVQQYALYLYLISNIGYRSNWTVRISDLKSKIKSDAKSYEDNRVFFNRKLKPMVDGINKTTSITVDYNHDDEYIYFHAKKKDILPNKDHLMALQSGDSLDDFEFEDFSVKYNIEIDELRNIYEKIDAATQNDFNKDYILKVMVIFLEKFSVNRAYSSLEISSVVEYVYGKALSNKVKNKKAYFLSAIKKIDLADFLNYVSNNIQQSLIDSDYVAPDYVFDNKLNANDFIDSNRISDSFDKIVSKYSEKTDLVDGETLKKIYDFIKIFTENEFSDNNLLGIIDTLVDKLLSLDCFSLSTACDYLRASYDILVSAETDTVIENPVKYIKGIIKNGHPEKTKKEWFLKKKTQADVKDKPKFMERPFSNADLDDFLEDCWNQE